MSTSDLASELTKEVLTCAICWEPFGPGLREARVLHCRHSFCVECLKEMYEENSLKCPECRCVSAVGRSVEESFPRDLTMMKVVQFLQTKLHRTVEDDPEDCASADLTPGAYLEFSLCQDCVNTKECQVHMSGDVLDNWGGSPWSQLGKPHTHPVHADPSLPCLKEPGSNEQNPSHHVQVTHPLPPSAAALLPRFHRMQRYCGTLGRVTLETGLHYWEVAAVVKGALLTNELLCEMGVGVPGVLDTWWRLLGHRVESVWGVRVWDCGQRRSLCVEGWEGTQRICLTTANCSRTPESKAKIRVGFLLDLGVGALTCLDATRGRELCTLHNVHPPLVPFFMVRPKSILFPNEVSLRLMMGNRTVLDKRCLNVLMKKVQLETSSEACGCTVESPLAAGSTGAEALYYM